MYANFVLTLVFIVDMVVVGAKDSIVRLHNDSKPLNNSTMITFAAYKQTNKHCSQFVTARLISALNGQIFAKHSVCIPNNSWCTHVIRNEMEAAESNETIESMNWNQFGCNGY